jgi:phosphoribosylformylglycinamidine synthase
MAAPQVCVLRAPGTNCDVETAHAFDACGGRSERVHLFRLLEQPAILKDAQILCVPGGFSYGDDIGAGVVFGAQLRSHLAAAIGEFLSADKLVLGICNGFQVLVKAGILPGGSSSWPPDPKKPRTTTLTWNENGKYTALWVNLRSLSRKCVFLKGIDDIELPIAHAEGRLVVDDPAVIDHWRENGQLALVYRDPQPPAPRTGAGPGSKLPYPVNPNGSTADIAGLCDPSGRVLGLMPHPERYQFATQHPQWTRQARRNGEGSGLKIFRNAIEYFRAS